jgi:hypothetical protein
MNGPGGRVYEVCGSGRFIDEEEVSKRGKWTAWGAKGERRRL